jgi:NADH dehydrogenase/NADH:ubiquinone oxidoreductase subunit G
MGKLVKIKINGNEYKVPQGVNLIDAAESVGVHIPNFCYLKGMRGIGACRMCMVEINGRMTAACIMKTKEGMDVVTENEKIRELRKFVVDLVLSMHPLDCMTCTKAGVCELQNYAYNFEVKESSYTRKKFGFPIDDKNPFIKRDPDYCILCGRCVRVCKEQGTSVLDFYGRGVGSKVTTAEDRPLQDAGCTFCGSCVDACPVNAILEADRWRKGREWDYSKFSSVCLSCGSACDTVVSVHGKDVAKVNSGGDEGRADHFICAYGRYGFDFINADNRVMSPLKRIDGELKPVSWKEAFETMAKVLANAGDVGIVTTGNLLNEDLLTIKNFAEAAGIRSMDSTVSLYADKPSLIGKETDIEDKDLILLVGVNPSEWKRVLSSLDATIRKKVARGTKLVIINSSDVKLSEVANITLKGEKALRIAGIVKALIDNGMKAPEGLSIPDVEVTEDIVKVAELYSEAKSPLIISSPNLYEACSNLALIKGDVISVPVEANAKGTILMGLKGTGMHYTDMVSGGAKVLYAIGEVPMKRPEGVETLIVQHSHLSDLAKDADLVLPASTHYETAGSVIDYMGRLRRLEQAIEPFGDSMSHREIMKGIARQMKIDLKVARTTDVKKRVNSAETRLEPSEFRKRENLAFNPDELIPELNRTMINGSRLLWLQEVEKAVAV